jgi:Flp pilus assembly protein TadG
VAVEFALVFPLLVMLLFGIITAGISFAHSLGLTNAVREGARFGAISDASPASG